MSLIPATFDVGETYSSDMMKPTPHRPMPARATSLVFEEMECVARAYAILMMPIDEPDGVSWYTCRCIFVLAVPLVDTILYMCPIPFSDTRLREPDSRLLTPFH